MGRRPMIQRDTAVRAALDIVDADGPGALSLEKMAAKLGIRAPSLYNHFSDKAEILSEVARSIVLETSREPDPGADDDWKQWLVEACVLVRQALLAHQRAVPIVVEYFPRGLLEKLYAEHCRVLGAHGVPVNFQMFILESIHRMTIGSAMCVATGRPAMAPFAKPEQFDADLASTMQNNSWSDERLFVEMLRVFLEGVETEIAQSA
ncbi:TetR family transcriptional regulator [Rhodococcus sp. T2V]|uniref:TetR/AcrR family transcriptional regulator n=1 Tax=Rhodococcus sp. T2V TaxID=3034164 RepID=UPI0023E2A53C|nr:TetR family transcriptional regulator [Rhodococcus sp. T2V]MDF3306638.1 TetR family transcriptional regulator [Rhodococcus sp. T2V]